AQTGLDRYREPARPVGRLDPVAILPAVLLVLHGVEEHEQVSARPFREVAEPGQIVRLVNGDFHRLASPAAAARPPITDSPTRLARSLDEDRVAQQPSGAARVEPIERGRAVEDVAVHGPDERRAGPDRDDRA